MFDVYQKDLKKYKFYYWFAFPALCPETNASSVESPVLLADYFTPTQVRDENADDLGLSPFPPKILIQSFRYIFIMLDGIEFLNF